MIKTFSQALPILTAHGIAPEAAGNHLWRVGAMTYDKGGIIALARRYEQEEIGNVTTQLTTTTDNVIVGVPMMDATEARAVVTRIKTRIDLARGELLELKDREGWKALGYKSWRQCAEAEFGASTATLYRQLEAAEIARDLQDSQFENLPTSQLQAVKQLPPEQRIEAFERADRIAGDGPRTAQHVRQAAQEIAAPFWQSIDAHHPTAHLWTRERPDLLRSGCGMTIQNRLPSGSTEGGHCSSCVRAQWLQSQATPAAQPAPALHPPSPLVSNLVDISDILKRLDAHGYAKSGTRQKGMTTFYSFRDYSGRSDETGGEIELAEGELSIWLAELDSRAAYAQRRQEAYLDARDRFAALGWTFTRDGNQFRLDDPQGKLYATTNQLDSHLSTLATFEGGAAKRAATAAASAAPTRLACPTCGENIMNGIWGDLKECGECYHARQRAAVAATTLAHLDAALPKDLEKAGYFWQSAQPPTIAHNDGWRGDARTLESAISLARDREAAKARPAFDTNAVARLSDKLGRATDRNAALDLWIAIGPLLEPKGVQQVISSWKPDEVQAFGAEADEALATLDIYGYTTIAAFVRETYTLLLDKEPPPAFAFKSQQQPVIATVDQLMAAPAIPLDPIRADLAAIAAWAAGPGNSAPLDELRGQLSDLAALRKRLDLLSDAPDVFDDDYESVSGALGDLEDLIRNWLSEERKETHHAA